MWLQEAWTGWKERAASAARQELTRSLGTAWWETNRLVAGLCAWRSTTFAAAQGAGGDTRSRRSRVPSEVRSLSPGSTEVVHEEGLGVLDRVKALEEQASSVVKALSPSHVPRSPVLLSPELLHRTPSPVPTGDASASPSPTPSRISSKMASVSLERVRNVTQLVRSKQLTPSASPETDLLEGEAGRDRFKPTIKPIARGDGGKGGSGHCTNHQGQMHGASRARIVVELTSSA